VLPDDDVVVVSVTEVSVVVLVTPPVVVDSVASVVELLVLVWGPFGVVDEPVQSRDLRPATAPWNPAL